MTQRVVDGDGRTFDHYKVTAPDNEALVTTSILNLPVADTMDMTYDISGNITQVVYKKDSATVGTMTMTYSGGLVSSVVVNNLLD